MGERSEIGGEAMLVLHPHDGDGETVARALRLAGCRVEQIWPPDLESLPRAAAVFCPISAATRRMTLALAERPGLAIIGMVEAADPDVPRLLHQLGIHAAIRKPIDPAAVPLALITARNNVRYVERLLGKVAKLEETLRAARKIERAKAALMAQRNVDEVAAYEYLRSQAMRKRMPIHLIAKAIVDYDEAITED